MPIILGLALTGGWLLYRHAYHRGGPYPLMLLVMAAATVVYALILASDLHLTGPISRELGKLAVQGNGYGVPLTHWLPGVPRPIILVAIIAAAGTIVDKAARRRGPR